MSTLMESRQLVLVCSCHSSGCRQRVRHECITLLDHCAVARLSKLTSRNDFIGVLLERKFVQTPSWNDGASPGFSSPSQRVLPPQLAMFSSLLILCKSFCANHQSKTYPAWPHGARPVQQHVLAPRLPSFRSHM